jgi:predicted NAD-dependent protein-ADP-ribosyltransferase YbiA (DUF1768 family)
MMRATRIALLFFFALRCSALRIQNLLPDIAPGFKMNANVKVKDPRVSPPASTAGVLGFYFPGKATAVDKLSGVPYLGNFWRMSPPFMFAPPKRDALPFTNAEAAFHACKFWKSGQHTGFSMIEGGAAFRLKRSLGGKEDFRFDTFGSSWQAMRAILDIKFAAGSDLAKMLVATEDTFLVEHDEKVRSASVWGSNKDGSGTNWLGAMLMLYRDVLKNQGKTSKTSISRRSWSSFINVTLNDRKGPKHKAWTDMVKTATKALNDATDAMKRSKGSGRKGRKPRTNRYRPT